MSKVSRSTYQKVVEENKRLLKDIKPLVESDPMSDEHFACYLKWRNKFEQERKFNNLSKLAVQYYIKANPNDPAVIGFKQIKESI